MFDADADKFALVLQQEATELYQSRETAFTHEIMRIVERDIYFQILDNLWMQHLEDMDHLREGIHWTSVGQRDPLVEYRRRGQAMFEAMQHVLRREVLRSILHAVPRDAVAEEEMHDTELTRAARSSVDNADTITEAESMNEEDFVVKKGSKKTSSTKKKKASRKAERQNRKKSRH